MKKRIRYFAHPKPRIEISSQTGTPWTVLRDPVEVPAVAVMDLPIDDLDQGLLPDFSGLPPGRYSLEVLVENARAEPEDPGA